MEKVTRREFVRTTIALSAMGAIGKRYAATDHPNLVIVFPDQMRGQALGFLKEDPVVRPITGRGKELFVGRR